MRLRVPDEGETVVTDVIRGEVAFPHAAIDDFVIARSDGSALYNLAVAVDDLDMGITHVVRGEDHLSNTPAAGDDPRARWEPSRPSTPTCRCCTGRTARSSRSATARRRCRSCARRGYLPEAVRNYIALLGWGLDESTTFMTTDELVEGFSLERVSKSPAVFDEQKLRWMNGRYLRELEPAELAARLEEQHRPGGPARGAATVAQEKMQTLADFWPLAGFLVERQPFHEKAWAKVMKDGALERLAACATALERVEPFDEPGVEARPEGRGRGASAVKPKEVFQPLRVAITGGTISPGHLRVGGRSRPGRDAGAHRRRAGARLTAAAAQPRAQPFVQAADRCQDGELDRREATIQWKLR